MDKIEAGSWLAERFPNGFRIELQHVNRPDGTDSEPRVVARYRPDGEGGLDKVEEEQ